MQEDHFPMTIFRLFDQEKADVHRYLRRVRLLRLSYDIAITKKITGCFVRRKMGGLSVSDTLEQ